jgi:hypothetical protein
LLHKNIVHATQQKNYLYDCNDPSPACFPNFPKLLMFTNKNGSYMNTKETLLESINLTPAIAAILNHIDFNRLTEFANARLAHFVGSRGLDAVRYDLACGLHSPTDAFLSNLLETGSVQLLKENGLLYHEQFIDALYVLIASLNVEVATFLRRQQVSQTGSYRYVDAGTLYLLLEQAVEQVYEAWQAEGYELTPSAFQLQHF